MAAGNGTLAKQVGTRNMSRGTTKVCYHRLLLQSLPKPTAEGSEASGTTHCLSSLAKHKTTHSIMSCHTGVTPQVASVMQQPMQASHATQAKARSCVGLDSRPSQHPSRGDRGKKRPVLLHPAGLPTSAPHHVLPPCPTSNPSHLQQGI